MDFHNSCWNIFYVKFGDPTCSCIGSYLATLC